MTAAVAAMTHLEPRILQPLLHLPLQSPHLVQDVDHLRACGVRVVVVVVCGDVVVVVVVWWLCGRVGGQGQKQAWQGRERVAVGDGRGAGMQRGPGEASTLGSTNGGQVRVHGVRGERQRRQQKQRQPGK